MTRMLPNKKSLMRYVYSQFGHPRGVVGGLAGFIMAHRASNRARNAWTVELLNVSPDSKVLEIGCGPGLSLAALAERCKSGLVVGVDRSSKMLAQAERRNREAVRAGRVVLQQGDVEDGVDVGKWAPFDRILLVNVVMFLKSPVETLGGLRGLLHKGGLLAITHQPRSPRATDEDALRAGEAHRELLEKAGFTRPRVEVLPLRPVCATSALAECGSE